MTLPNKCPICSLTEEADKPDAKNAAELEMRVGNRPTKELYSLQPLYLAPEHGVEKYRIVVCANCGCVYAKSVEETRANASTGLPPPVFPTAPPHKSGKEE